MHYRDMDIMKQQAFTSHRANKGIQILHTTTAKCNWQQSWPGHIKEKKI